MKKWKRITAGVLCGGLFAACLGGFQGYAQEESEPAMGRYLETSLEVPVSEIKDIVRMEDGALRIAGNYEGEGGEVLFGLFDSQDGGESWEMAASLPQEYGQAYITAAVLDRQGGGAAVVMTEDENSEDGYAWEILNFEGDGQAQAFPMAEDKFITSLAVAEGGSLIALAANGQAMTLDRSTGETLLELPSSDRANALGTFQNQALLLTSSEIQGIDLDSGTPQPRDESLNEALYAQGSSYESMTSSTYPIVFAEEEDRLYYATEAGIFSHTAGGSVVEQIVDGTLCSLSSPAVGLIALEADGEVFYAAVLNGDGGCQILKYEFSPDTPAVPDTELTIYSLEDNSELRQAIVLYQSANPDVYINYQTGMTGEDGMTVSDALRTLNTDILAGNGPDLLLLDGMSVDTYREQGLLLDLSPVVDELSQSDGLLENIADTYRTEDGVWAVPARFAIPVLVGESELIGQVESVEDLKNLLLQTGGEKLVIGPIDVVGLAEALYPVCAGSWQKEDGTIDSEKLREFVNLVKDVYDVQMEAMVSVYGQEYMDEYQENLRQYVFSANMPMTWDGDFTYGMIGLQQGEIQLKIGQLTDYFDMSEVATINEQEGKFSYISLPGQESGVYIPVNTYGVVSTSQKQEEALDFVKFLLSAEVQSQSLYFPMPVNKTAFENLLTSYGWGENTNYSMASSDTQTGEYVELNYMWMTEEEAEEFTALAESLDTPAFMDQIVKNTVLENLILCLDGEMSEEETVNAVMQTINLYLAE
ncbi:MAG TPA: extracellular solute-binding protein [Candidatus Choladousia intestinigallinarum]|nr:extracellular solute-binding protein [Candidatus Choladousia intestinigallinarum]